MKLLFLLVILPLSELYILIEVGAEIGGLNTIMLILASALLGGALMKQQGREALENAQRQMTGRGLGGGNQGNVGTVEQEMLAAMLIFVGGLMLFLPGFMTDVLGLLLLIPPIRRRLVNKIIQSQPGRMRQQAREGGNIYEAEWESKLDVAQVDILISAEPVKSKTNFQSSSHQDNDIIEGEVIEPKK